MSLPKDSPIQRHSPTFSVSNIAWTPEEDGEAFSMLREFGLSHLEVAPGRVWPAAGETPLETVREGMGRLSEAGLRISGFQAILFGKPDLSLFDATSRPALGSYLNRLAAVCATAGGSYLVFGAPKNRWIPEEMPRDQAVPKAVEFFHALGEHAKSLGVCFGIEANPAAYGCNFCTDISEVSALVRTIDSPGIRWHLDTGEMAMNAEAIPERILENADLISSLHVSQPNLGDFASPWNGHRLVAAALKSCGYTGPISLEMKRPAGGLQQVREAISFLLEVYR
jgi:D-psicose/D-tagatose/L-ribulose 3-epimerase